MFKRGFLAATFIAALGAASLGIGSKLDTALGENFYSFDVTPHLQNIARKPHGAGASDALFLRIVPGGVPVKDAGPMVAQIDLMRQ